MWFQQLLKILSWKLATNSFFILICVNYRTCKSSRPHHMKARLFPSPGDTWTIALAHSPTRITHLQETPSNITDDYILPFAHFEPPLAFKGSYELESVCPNRLEGLEMTVPRAFLSWIRRRSKSLQHTFLAISVRRSIFLPRLLHRISSLLCNHGGNGYLDIRTNHIKKIRRHSVTPGG